MEWDPCLWSRVMTWASQQMAPHGIVPVPSSSLPSYFPSVHTALVTYFLILPTLSSSGFFSVIFLPLIHTFKSAVDNSRPDEVHFQISIISTEGSFHILGFSLELFLHWVYERHLINVFKVWVIKRCRPDLGGMINTFSNERQKRNLFSHWLKQTHTKWMNLVFAQKDFPNGSFLWAPSFALKAKAFISLHNCRIWRALGITPPQCF